MERKLFKMCLLAIVLIFSCLSISADDVTVVLKQGYKLKGSIVSYDGKTLSLSQGEGKKLNNLKMVNVDDVLNEDGESIINDLTIVSMSENAANMDASDSTTMVLKANNYFKYKFIEQEALLKTRRTASIVTLCGVGTTAIGLMTVMSSDESNYNDRWDAGSTLMSIGGIVTVVGGILYTVTNGRLVTNNFHISENIIATIKANGITITF